MKINTFNFPKTLNKISVYQLVVILLIGLVFYFQNKLNIFTGFVISGIVSFAYTQFLKFSYYSKFFALFGFPFRIIIVGTPCAILVHKLHSNLIALFSGFAISLFIYLFCIWLETKDSH